jgi:hypothetical protein
MAQACNPRRLKPKNFEFKSSLGYTMRPCLKKKKTTTTTKTPIIKGYYPKEVEYLLNILRYLGLIPSTTNNIRSKKAY